MIQAQRIEETALDNYPATAKTPYDAQLNRLLRLGYPQAAGLTEGQFLNEITPLQDLFCARQETLIVIPTEMVALEIQMLKARTRFPLDLPQRWHHTDPLPIPEVPYAAVDVSDGREWHDVSPLDCLRRFAKNERLGLTVVEGLALLTHYPRTLRTSKVDLPGSYCGRAMHTPFLRRATPEHIVLDYRYNSVSMPTSGSASCRARLAP